MRVLVAGGAGFLGSHLCDALLARGDEVVAVDNLCTGSLGNLASATEAHAGRFAFVNCDISVGLEVDGVFDCIANLASPASPPAYLAMPLETLAVGSEGTRRLIERAERDGARFVHASTSEVYGDPDVHPQREDYWGNVNPIGPRSVYDESKRFAEALIFAHERTLGTNIGVARIFNTYGPRLDPGDGRVVSNFIVQALAGEPLTVYGDGSQTRSPCYVSDLVAGLVALIDAPHSGPINLGNPEEVTMLELAERVLALTSSSSTIEFRELPTDDPTRRRPDISRAREQLGWAPTVALDDGLARTIEHFAAA